MDSEGSRIQSEYVLTVRVAARRHVGRVGSVVFGVGRGEAAGTHAQKRRITENLQGLLPEKEALAHRGPGIVVEDGNLLPILRMRELYSSKVLEGEEKDIESFDIEFKNVSFGYEDEKVLKDVSFTAKQGEVTALVGPSGCGKSTITKLMLRFWDPDSGTVTLGKNDINLIDYHQILKKQ